MFQLLLWLLGLLVAAAGVMALIVALGEWIHRRDERAREFEKERFHSKHCASDPMHFLDPEFSVPYVENGSAVAIWSYADATRSRLEMAGVRQCRRCDHLASVTAHGFVSDIGHLRHPRQLRCPRCHLHFGSARPARCLCCAHPLDAPAPPQPELARSHDPGVCPECARPGRRLDNTSVRDSYECSTCSTAWVVWPEAARRGEPRAKLLLDRWLAPRDLPLVCDRVERSFREKLAMLCCPGCGAPGLSPFELRRERWGELLALVTCHCSMLIEISIWRVDAAGDPRPIQLLPVAPADADQECGCGFVFTKGEMLTNDGGGCPACGTFDPRNLDASADLRRLDGGHCPSCSKPIRCTEFSSNIWMSDSEHKDSWSKSSRSVGVCGSGEHFFLYGRSSTSKGGHEDRSWKRPLRRSMVRRLLARSGVTVPGVPFP